MPSLSIAWLLPWRRWRSCTAARPCPSGPDGGQQARRLACRAGSSLIRVACRMNWPTISAAPRLRVRSCVPVWQNRQEQRAADLRGDAYRGLLAIGDVDGLRLLPVAKGTGISGVSSSLAATAYRVGPADDEAFRELLLQRPGDRGHTGEMGDAPVIDPMPDLLGAKRRLADRRHLGGEFARRQAPSSRLPSASGGGGSNSADFATIPRAVSAAVRSAVRSASACRTCLVDRGIGRGKAAQAESIHDHLAVARAWRACQRLLALLECGNRGLRARGRTRCSARCRNPGPS